MTVARTPPLRRTIVVASAEPARRRELAGAVDRLGDTVVRCCGPFDGCLLGEGRIRCPLLATADLAVVDLERPCSAFLRHCERDHPDLPLRFARSAEDARMRTGRAQSWPEAISRISSR